GCGGMAQDVIAALRAAGTDSGVRIIGALARPGRGDVAGAKLPGIDIVEALDQLIARKPKMIAEVAGQAAGAGQTAVALARGVDCRVISIGALADAALFARLKAAAHAGKSRILLPAGAIGGIGALAAMRIGGLTSVRYRSRKPPLAWRGSPAEEVVDLGKLAKPAVLYKGTAGGAAPPHPPNADRGAPVAPSGLRP